ncbi:MAG: diguanylate cyclase [Eubacterium sp.]|nr:diguanylate cyclase [Eubacterium sp.]
MKSIRTRIITTFIVSILTIFMVLAAVGVYYIIVAINMHTDQSMRLLIEEKSGELNTYFSGVERTVEVLENYLHAETDYDKYESDDQYRGELIDDLRDLALSSATIVDNVESVYFRPDPEKYGGTSGFFLTEVSEGELKSVTPTDILSYDEDDIEHVGWYYQAIKSDKAIWMEPYSNENISVYIMSYVVPVYIGSDFLGVLGVDIDMSLVHQTIDRLNYDSSTGMLMSSAGNLLYHKDYPGGLLKDEFTDEISEASQFFTSEYIGTGENYKYVAARRTNRIIVSRLDNGMILAIYTPESELFGVQYRMMFQLAMVFIAALIIVIVVSVKVTGRIVTPIRELTAASSRIAQGELGQEIAYQSDDEIGSLADSIRKISVELKVYIDYIHEQAYLDAMTGVYNKAAYMVEEARLERLIREDMAAFSIYVFDVNGLKRMNDTKGHEYGDMMIKDAALNIKAVFDSGQVYRIGGDEFIAFAPELTDEEIRRQFARFDEQLRVFNSENEKYEEDLAISKGVAVYSAGMDADFASVFARADEDMYRCKEEYYRKHGGRRRTD